MTDASGFMKFKRQEITRRPVAERILDWMEVDVSPIAKESVPFAEFLKKQSHRCMDCGVAFCQGNTGCPVNNLIPEWNQLIGEERWQEASARLHSTNNFPEFTGRLCPAPCESACVLGVNSDPVNIKGMEWSIVDKAFVQGWVQSQKQISSSGKKIAVVGSGPTGLAAAQQLARSGHAVTVFEKNKFIGGLLRYGIPDFKLQKNLIDRRVLQLQEEGVFFQTSCEFGTDVTLAEIKKQFDAMVLATGAEVPRDISIPGRSLSGIHRAMDYLTQQNQLLGGEISDLKINAKGKNVLILGGGDTGSDCLGTAIRQGARQVLQFEIQAKPPKERSPQTPWPMWPMKLKSSHAHEEGGVREWSLQTEEFIGEDGVLKKIKARCLDTQKEIYFDVDLVVLALGFTGVSRSLQKAIPDLQYTNRETLALDFQGMTSVDGIFACGDNHRGASLIVWAIAEGRKVAQSLNNYLESRSFKSSP